MTIRAKIKRLADVPEALREFYTKTEDGTFVLGVEAVDGLGLGEIDAMRADGNRLWDALQGQLRDAAVDKAITAAGGNLTLLGPHLRERIKIDRETLKVSILTTDGKKAFTTKGQASTVADLVDEYRRDETFARAFDRVESAAAATDVPTKPANPWGEGTFTDHLRKVAAERAKSAPSRHSGPIVLDPKATGFNMTDAMAWAHGDAAREAELRRAMAGRS